MVKAFPTDTVGRIREIQSDPCNERIPRVENAGRIVDDLLVMHNGLKVHPMSRCYMRLLAANQGCHEPQEEFLFQQVLQRIPPGGTILELGAYWSFYSMWFAHAVPGSRCFLVEPDPKNLELGRRNFETNGLRGHFILNHVGASGLQVDDFCESQGIEFLDVLHADVQCAELEMLEGAQRTLNQGRIGYIFLGTHGQDLHYRCKQFLEERGYLTLAHADWDHGTYCSDGIILARLASLPGLEPVDLPLREPHQPYVIGSRMEDLNSLMRRKPGPLKRLAVWVEHSFSGVLWRGHARKRGPADDRLQAA